MKYRFQRAHLRAPLKTFVLFNDEQYVLKAKVFNISKGGIFLENLPHFPGVKLMPMMIDIVHYPDFQALRFDRIGQLAKRNFERNIFRAKAKIVRSFESESDVDKVFVNNIGCEFVDLDEKKQDLILNYVNRFAKNTIFLLSLFENLNNKKEEINRLRFISGILGYDKDLPLPKLRQVVLHDYQSLEDI